MKKRILSTLLTFAMILSIAQIGFFTPIASAETTPAGLEYSIKDGEVTITDYTGSATKVVIPAEIEGYPVTSIGRLAFYKCSLTSITIPEGVTTIGYEAFYYCTNLTSITIPDSVNYIGSYAFYNTAYVNNLNNWENKLLYCGNHLLDASGTITNCTIKKGTKTIAPSAFSGCYSLTSVTILEGVTSIGDSAFSSCNRLTSITLPEGVTYIGEGAFYNCTNLTSITIPEGVTSIGDSTFYDCFSLTSITIPEGVTSIGNSAFSWCLSLTSITIPEGVTYIGEGAFYNCTDLTSITIPEGVTSIGDSTFYNCSSLTSITIPKGVTSIGNSAFGDTGLKYVFYEGTSEQKQDIAITMGGNDPLIFDAIWHFETTDHLWDSGVITTQPTCEDGERTFACTECDATKKETIKATGHTLTTLKAKAATCTATGLTEGKKCSNCGKVTAAQKEIAKLGHSYKTTTTKATLSKNGKIVKACTRCDYVASSTTLYKIKSVKLSTTSYTYNGKAKRPIVVVKDSKGKTVSKSYYTVKYTNNKKIGKATVKVTFKTRYSGSKTLSFKINTKKVTNLKLKSPAKKQLTVSWKKDSSAGGYEIVYATNSKFTKGKKTVKVTSAKKTIKKLKSKGTYYVKVRSYKKVGSTTYYGAYTSAKKLKIK